MNAVEIYRNGALLATIQPDSNASQVKQMMGDNIINLSFALSSYVDFKYGDNCTVFNESYKLNTTPNVKKLGENNWQYTLRMEAEYFDLTKVQYLFLGQDNTLKETDFSLMGTARTFIELLIENANRVSPGWKKGDVSGVTYKNLTFSKENCLQVLSRLAEEFGTEYWVEGKTIHLSKRRNISSLTLRQGKNKGLYNINRQPLSGSKIVTRLYAFGSEKNLPTGYRNGALRLKMTGGKDYVEQNLSTGLIEDNAVFDDIYPHRTGKVTGVGADIYTFYDNTLDFDIKQYLLPGVEPKLTFNTGQLAGYTFKLNRTLNSSAKEIKILPNTEEKALVIPSNQLKPAIGDQYVIFDISMPQVYITKAEAELEKAAKKLLAKISVPQHSYNVDVDITYMKRRNITLSVGMEIGLKDDDLGVDERLSIVSCTRYIQNENKYSIELSDKKVSGTVQQLQNTQVSNSRDIQNIQRTYNTIQDNKVVGDLNINQGSVVFDALPVLSGPVTDYAQIFINRTTGKLAREA